MAAAAAAAAGDGDGAAALPEPPDDELAGLARAVRGTLSLAGGGGGRPPAADGGGGTDPSSTPPPPHPHPPPPPLTAPPPPGTAGQVPPGGAVIICDLWYGLPTQRRPRRERVNAVARQLRNFEAWRSGRRRRSRRVGEGEEEESWEGGGGGGGDCGSDCGAARGSGARFRAVLVGDGADVGAVKDRLRSLRSDEGLGNRDRDHGHDGIIELLPGRTVEGEAGRLLQGAGAGAGAVYLSPDAPASLDARRPPPRAVVVGMLIDRRVIPNRSLRQAERLSLPAFRLPMDQLRVEGLRSSEALNVDTVLELMERWWDGVDGLAEGSGDDGDCLRRCFLDAALGAMRSHEDRHPNRPVHGSGSQK